MKKLWSTLLLVATTWLSPSVATATNVTILRPHEHSSTAAQAAVRLKLELLAAGFNVDVMPYQAPLSSRAAELRQYLEDLARESDALAVILLVPIDDGAAADVWIVDRATNKMLVRRIEAEASSSHGSSAALALKATDLLRASLIELDHEATAQPQTQPPSPGVTEFIAAPTAQPSTATRSGLGVLSFIGLNGLGLGAGPMALFEHHITSHLAARMWWAPWLGSKDIQRQHAEASLDQSAGAAGVRYRWNAKPWALSAGCDVGYYRLHVEGRSRTTSVTGSDGATALLTTLNIAGDYGWSWGWTELALGIAAALPSPKLALAEQPIGRVVAPAATASWTLGAAW